MFFFYKFVLRRYVMTKCSLKISYLKSGKDSIWKENKVKYLIFIKIFRWKASNHIFFPSKIKTSSFFFCFWVKRLMWIWLLVIWIISAYFIIFNQMFIILWGRNSENLKVWHKQTSSFFQDYICWNNFFLLLKWQNKPNFWPDR